MIITSEDYVPGSPKSATRAQRLAIGYLELLLRIAGANRDVTIMDPLKAEEEPYKESYAKACQQIPGTFQQNIGRDKDLSRVVAVAVERPDLIVQLAAPFGLDKKAFAATIPSIKEISHNVAIFDISGDFLEKADRAVSAALQKASAEKTIPLDEQLRKISGLIGVKFPPKKHAGFLAAEVRAGGEKVHGVTALNRLADLVQKVLRSFAGK